MTYLHRWQLYADTERIWTVCIDCGAEKHVTTHAEALADSIGYIMDFRSAAPKWRAKQHTQQWATPDEMADIETAMSRMLPVAPGSPP